MLPLTAVVFFAAAVQPAAPESSPAPLPSAASPLAAAAAPVPPGVAPEPASSREIYEVHLAIDIPVTVAGWAVGLGRELFKDRFARISCPCDASKLNPLDRGTVGNHNHFASVAADVSAYGVPSLLPLLDLLDLGPHRAFGEDLLIYAETLGVDIALQNGVNFAVARPRPLAYAGNPAYVHAAEGYLSFYAGHVANAFAALSAASYTIRRRYGGRVWPWIVTGLVGASIAVERVASGHHFPTDVAVAAVAGTAVGITVPWLHVRAREARVGLAPVSFGAGGGLGLVGAF